MTRPPKLGVPKLGVYVHWPYCARICPYCDFNVFKDRKGDEPAVLTVRTRRFAHGVRVHVPGFDPSDDAFSVEPGGERRIELTRAAGDAPADRGALTALNLIGRVAIADADGDD